MDIEVVTPPEPEAHLGVVSLDEMKRHLAIMNDARDEAIKDAIRDAVDFFDFRNGVLNRSVLQRRIRIAMSAFPCNGVELRIPYAPVREIISIGYRLGDGTTETMAPADYVSLAGAGSGEIAVLRQGGWPYMRAYPRGLVVEADVGYETIPPLLKRGVKLLAAHYLRNPDATVSSDRAARVGRAIQFGVEHIVSSCGLPAPYGEPV